MPRTTIWIDVSIRHLRQRQVGRPALRPAGRSVHGRARQGMAEGHALFECQQSVRLVNRRERDPEPFASALQQQRIADRVGRCDEQQTSRVLGERLESSEVALLDPFREIGGLRHAEPTGQLRRCQPSGQLEQRERVSSCLREDPVAYSPVQREPHCRAQQRAGITVERGRAPRDPAGAEAPRQARVLRTRAPLAQPTTGERRTRASAPRPDPATARRR